MKGLCISPFVVPCKTAPLGKLYKYVLSVFETIRGTRGKIVNQEEMNVANDIEISESLKLHE